MTHPQNMQIPKKEDIFRLSEESSSPSVSALVSKLNSSLASSSLFYKDTNDAKGNSSTNNNDKKIEEIWPWLSTFHNQCRGAVGSKNIKLFENLLMFYLRNIGDNVKSCYTKPNRAAKLKESMYETLIFFHLFYQDIREPIENSYYLDKMTVLVSMYMDMEIKASRRRKEGAQKLARKITTALFVFLDNSIDHILDAILKSKFFNKNFKDICVPILSTILGMKRIKRPPYDMLYVRYILAFKLWKKVAGDFETKLQINNIAVETLVAPKNFIDKSKLYSKVLPWIPKTKKKITHFLMVAKFNLKSACQAFLKMVNDSQQSGFSSSMLMDKPLYFENRDGPRFSEYDQIGNEETGMCSLISGIWSTISSADANGKTSFDISSETLPSPGVALKRKERFLEKPVKKKIKLEKQNSSDIHNKQKQVKSETIKKENKNKKSKENCKDNEKLWSHLFEQNKRTYDRSHIDFEVTIERADPNSRNKQVLKANEYNKYSDKKTSNKQSINDNSELIYRVSPKAEPSKIPFPEKLNKEKIKSKSKEKDLLVSVKQKKKDIIKTKIKEKNKKKKANAQINSKKEKLRDFNENNDISEIVEIKTIKPTVQAEIINLEESTPIIPAKKIKTKNNIIIKTESEEIEDSVENESMSSSLSLPPVHYNALEKIAHSYNGDIDTPVLSPSQENSCELIPCSQIKVEKTCHSEQINNENKIYSNNSLSIKETKNSSNEIQDCKNVEIPKISKVNNKASNHSTQLSYPISPKKNKGELELDKRISIKLPQEILIDKESTKNKHVNQSISISKEKENDNNSKIKNSICIQNQDKKEGTREKDSTLIINDNLNNSKILNKSPKNISKTNNSVPLEYSTSSKINKSEQSDDQPQTIENIKSENEVQITSSISKQIEKENKILAKSEILNVKLTNANIPKVIPQNNLTSNIDTISISTSLESNLKSEVISNSTITQQMDISRNKFKAISSNSSTLTSPQESPKEKSCIKADNDKTTPIETNENELTTVKTEIETPSDSHSLTNSPHNEKIISCAAKSVVSQPQILTEMSPSISEIGTPDRNESRNQSQLEINQKSPSKQVDLPQVKSPKPLKEQKTILTTSHTNTQLLTPTQNNNTCKTPTLTKQVLIPQIPKQTTSHQHTQNVSSSSELINSPLEISKNQAKQLDQSPTRGTLPKLNDDKLSVKSKEEDISEASINHPLVKEEDKQPSANVNSDENVEFTINIPEKEYEVPMTFSPIPNEFVEEIQLKDDSFSEIPSSLAQKEEVISESPTKALCEIENKNDDDMICNETSTFVENLKELSSSSQNCHLSSSASSSPWLTLTEEVISNWETMDSQDIESDTKPEPETPLPKAITSAPSSISSYSTSNKENALKKNLEITLQAKHIDHLHRIPVVQINKIDMKEGQVVKISESKKSDITSAQSSCEAELATFIVRKSPTSKLQGPADKPNSSVLKNKATQNISSAPVKNIINRSEEIFSKENNQSPSISNKPSHPINKTPSPIKEIITKAPYSSQKICVQSKAAVKLEHTLAFSNKSEMGNLYNEKSNKSSEVKSHHTEKTLENKTKVEKNNMPFTDLEKLPNVDQRISTSEKSSSKQTKIENSSTITRPESNSVNRSQNKEPTMPDEKLKNTFGEQNVCHVIPNIRLELKSAPQTVIEYNSRKECKNYENVISPKSPTEITESPFQEEIFSPLSEDETAQSSEETSPPYDPLENKELQEPNDETLLDMELAKEAAKSAVRAAKASNRNLLLEQDLVGVPGDVITQFGFSYTYPHYVEGEIEVSTEGKLTPSAHEEEEMSESTGSPLECHYTIAASPEPSRTTHDIDPSEEMISFGGSIHTPKRLDISDEIIKKGRKEKSVTKNLQESTNSILTVPSTSSTWPDTPTNSQTDIYSISPRKDPSCTPPTHSPLSPPLSYQHIESSPPYLPESDTSDFWNLENLAIDAETRLYYQNDNASIPFEKEFGFILRDAFNLEESSENRYFKDQQDRHYGDTSPSSDLSQGEKRLSGEHTRAKKSPSCSLTSSGGSSSNSSGSKQEMVLTSSSPPRGVNDKRTISFISDPGFSTGHSRDLLGGPQNSSGSGYSSKEAPGSGPTRNVNNKARGRPKKEEKLKIQLLFLRVKLVNRLER